MSGEGRKMKNFVCFVLNRGMCVHQKIFFFFLYLYNNISRNVNYYYNN